MSRPRVLVVDADRRYREQLIYALKENYQLFEAEDRESALQYLEEEKRPDVVLTDLYLPPRLAYIDEGLALLREFKDSAPGIKVIIVTTDERREVIAKCRELGAEDYIVKPFEVDNLKNAIDRLIPKAVPPRVEPMLKGIERRRYWRERDGRQVGVERRKFWRVRCEIPISYSLYRDELRITRESRTIDMSANGVRFHVDQPITTHTVLGLHISLQSRPLVIEATGEVRWVRKVEGAERYDLGTQFIEIHHQDRQRIIDYIYRT